MTLRRAPFAVKRPAHRPVLLPVATHLPAQRGREDGLVAGEPPSTEVGEAEGECDDIISVERALEQARDTLRLVWGRTTTSGNRHPILPVESLREPGKLESFLRIPMPVGDMLLNRTNQ